MEKQELQKGSNMKRGFWKAKRKEGNNKIVYECSVCGKETSIGYGDLHEVCMNCMTPMVGENWSEFQREEESNGDT